MPNRDPVPTPSAEPPLGPQPTPNDRIQKKPPVAPAQDPSDPQSPEGRPLDPALLPIGDPAGAA